MMSDHIRTYESRISNFIDEPLSKYASLMTTVKHKLFTDLSKGKESSILKSSYLIQYGITARQFNGIRVSVEGKIRSIKERQKQLIEEKKEEIATLEKKISRIKNALLLHLKKRKLSRLHFQLKALQKKATANKFSLCFGSRKLFHSQFHLEENQYSSHEEWKKEWQEARASEIFILGSKDEISGNQSCTATLTSDDSLALRIRMPNQLIPECSKYIVISNIRFAYGHKEIKKALLACKLRHDLFLAKDPSYKNHGQAITYRFKKDAKGWRLFVSTNVTPEKFITNSKDGVIGVDINSDHLAVAELDRYGNLLQKITLPLNLYDKSLHQNKALIGDATKQIISLCEKTKKPLVVENLDFQKKRAQLREEHATKYNRMLSSFAYQSILIHLKARGASKGIEVYNVNPAFTSLIGRVKFAKRYGLSIHIAAALCIGRRYLGCSERMPQPCQEFPDGKGGHVTLDLPVRNRTRHVWHQWKLLSKKLPAALTAHFRTVKHRSLSPPTTTPVTEILPDIIGEIPIRESLTLLFC